MHPKHPWIWKTYLIIMLLFVIKNLYFLFSPDSQIFFYYFVLRAFDPVFYITYAAHVMQVLLSAIHWIPVFLYVYRIRFLSADFWKSLFILRCIFEITGHSYEMNSLIALYYKRPKTFWIITFIFMIPHIPSYVVCYLYAFRQQKILPEVISSKPA